VVEQVQDSVLLVLCVCTSSSAKRLLPLLLLLLLLRLALIHMLWFQRPTRLAVSSNSLRLRSLRSNDTAGQHRMSYKTVLVSNSTTALRASVSSLHTRPCAAWNIQQDNSTAV
jgi:hypothetical protein